VDYTEFSFDYSEKNDFDFALLSDLHLDSPTFAKADFVADANKYQARGARFLINGDVFDAILPTDRKRYTRANDGFNEDAQINARLDFAVNLLKPYVNSIDFIGIGNHEASITKYDHCDMIKLLVSELARYRDPSLPAIRRGSYQGFIRLWFRAGNGATRQYIIYREHGKGGNSPVTKSTISLNRLNTVFIANLYWLGHSHGNLTSSGWNIYPDNSGKIIQEKTREVVTAGYQKGFEQRDLTDDVLYRNSFPEEKFLVPTGIGAALLHINVPKSHGTTELNAEITS
jgi:hypothetical protein